MASYLTHHCSRPVAVLHMSSTATREKVPLKPPAETTSPTLLAEEAAARAAFITKEGGREEAGSPPASARNLLVAVDGSDDSFESVRWTLENMYRKGKGIGVSQ